MADCSALEAHRLLASVADCIVFPPAASPLSLCVSSLALYLRAPFQICIFFYFNIKNEFFVFVKYLVTPKILYICFCKLLFAIRVHAVYIDYFSIFNIGWEMACHTVFTVLVIALGQAKEINIFIIVSAN